MTKKTLLVGLVAILLVSLLAGCVSTTQESTTSEVAQNGSQESSSSTTSTVDYSTLEEAFHRGSSQYDPEWAVVPPRLIGAALGTTEEDISFDPYGVSAPLESEGNAAAGNNPFTAVIPAGSEYYEIQGFDSETYLALQNGANYFLYANSPSERLHFYPGYVDDSLTSSFTGSEEQAYLEAFIFVAALQTRFIVLDILPLDIGNADDLITLIAHYCDTQGTTLLVTSYNTVKEKGYLTFESGEEYNWVFYGGMFVSLDEGVFSGDTATIEASFRAGPLFGSGTRFNMEMKDNKWVVKSIEELWIS